ncbi:allophanate hydrolase subunit 1 [Devosia sp.]|uniref:5-oxoprolinase subunit B family protein n=1 Tax=Devosia sp. TaxID=1871048 RepID=UPI001B1C342B|nr:allophanate hydrolase subunit 1 [Devosia sp.]MBO9587862.1 allophanate hydrolase subunit 1 [Devosia sp.]
MQILPERPMVQALGDSAILVRFGSRLDENANRRAIGFAATLESEEIAGIIEVVPSLVSVLLRYDPLISRHQDIEGEIRLRLHDALEERAGAAHGIGVRFGGEAGPDLEEVAGLLKISAEKFMAQHNAVPLRVLATGFAPGFVYCGFHPDALVLPRRDKVRALVPAGSVLFAAGQTAIAATDIPTGWHVIGHTDFSNFDPAAEPPTRLRAGDSVSFEVA